MHHPLLRSTPDSATNLTSSSGDETTTLLLLPLPRTGPAEKDDVWDFCKEKKGETCEEERQRMRISLPPPTQVPKTLYIYTYVGCLVMQARGGGKRKILIPGGGQQWSLQFLLLLLRSLRPWQRKRDNSMWVGCVQK